MSPSFARLHLLPVGLHLLAGAAQVALIFPFASQERRLALRQRWSRRLLQRLCIRVDAMACDGNDPVTGLLAANHVSFVDIFVINAVWPSAFVAKSDVAAWPLIGWLCRRNDTVFIERGNRRAAHDTHRGMREALAAGRRLAIFPEGTTSAGDGVLPFHGALFQSAIDAGAPVHALALSYHGPGGGRSAAAAYVGDIGIVECMLNILRDGPLVARLVPAATLAPPQPDRRHLARRCHQAVAHCLAEGPPVAAAPDPTNRGGKPFSGPAQPGGNDAAINP